MDLADGFLPLGYLQVFGNLAQGGQRRQAFAANGSGVLVVWVFRSIVTGHSGLS
jgi:hypothetical protein